MLRQNIEVTQDKKLVNPAIHVVQGDTGRTVVALVKDATISGTATMAFERPDGATYTTTATVNSDNSVEATFTADMLRVAGTGKATFKVVSSGSQVSTYQLYVLVEPSAGFERPVTPSNNKIYVYVNGSPVEVATAAEVASKASQSQVDGISATVNNLVGRIVEDENNIAINTATLRNKMNKVRIDFDGTNFKIGTRTLNYKELYDIHISNPDFGFVVYGDRAYLLSYVQDGAGMKEMRFQSTIATTDSSNLSYTKTSGIYVTSSDGINIASARVADINSENKAYKATEFTEANKNSDVWYPSNKAVNNVVSELKDDLDKVVNKSDNKNLVNWTAVKLATYLQTNGTETANENHWCTDFFEIEPNTAYCLAEIENLGDVYWANCCQYDENKSFIPGTTVANSHTVTTNANAKYVRFGRRYENKKGSGIDAEITIDNYLSADYVINKCQFQKGSTPSKIIDDVLNPDIKVTTANMSAETLAEIRNVSRDYWYTNKYLLSYGDSIVEQKKWQDYVKNYFKCSAVYNNGIGGTCVANNGKTVTLWNGQVINGWMCGDDRIDLARRNYGLVQAVILLGGHNDFASNIPLGDLESLDDTKFKSAYALMIKKIMGIFPNAKIYAMTPANSKLSANATNRDTEVKNSLGLTMSDYANAVKEVCFVYGIPVIDIFGESGMSVLNGSKYVTDTIHPNDNGGKLIANVVINRLKACEPIDL